MKGEGLFYAFNKKRSHQSSEDSNYAFPTNFGLRDNSSGVVARIGINRRF